MAECLGAALRFGLSVLRFLSYLLCILQLRGRRLVLLDCRLQLEQVLAVVGVGRELEAARDVMLGLGPLALARVHQGGQHAQSGPLRKEPRALGQGLELGAVR